jgi:hypothetical protein
MQISSSSGYSTPIPRFHHPNTVVLDVKILPIAKILDLSFASNHSIDPSDIIQYPPYVNHLPPFLCFALGHLQK